LREKLFCQEEYSTRDLGDFLQDMTISYMPGLLFFS
jgi:hypothetical protein